MTTSHTPGPWYKSTAENDLAIICHRNIDGDERVIARLSSRQEIGDEVSDARLISAAPDLLEALTDILDAIEFSRDPSQTPFASEARARAAIAKATGEAQ